MNIKTKHQSSRGEGQGVRRKKRQSSPHQNSPIGGLRGLQSSLHPSPRGEGQGEAKKFIPQTCGGEAKLFTCKNQKSCSLKICNLHLKK